MSLSQLKIEYPEDLPVSKFRSEILQAVSGSQVVAVVGDTGSGKTTQLPKLLYEYLGASLNNQCIAVTQPRRVAAFAVASRIAEETAVKLGQQVGYAMRFDKQYNQDTRIKVMTDGVMLAEISRDPLLLAYEAIILDEVHERSLNIDFLMGYLSRILAQRPSLRVVLSSATLNVEPLRRIFPRLALVEVPGRMFPVEYHYETEERVSEFGLLELCKEHLKRLCDSNLDGDVLVFLPTERDILELQQDLEGALGDRVTVLPLFGRLSAGKQREIFVPTRRRKVVLATNIAETSVTVPGIRFVIDSGLARISSYSPSSRTLRLPIVPVALSSLTQRAGRCGRVGPGQCYRLFPENDLADRRASEKPEIVRTNLAGVILQMHSYNLGAVEDFPFPDPPAPYLIAGAYKLLNQLGALNGVEITAVGRRLARLPVDPSLGRVLLAAEEANCLAALIVIVAGLTVRDARVVPVDDNGAATRAHARYHTDSSDFIALLNLWNFAHEEPVRSLSQSHYRKFCHQHFLSYQVIREWRQLAGDLWRYFKNGRNEFVPVAFSGQQAIIHQCLLKGLIGKIGLLQKDRNYKFAGNKIARVQRFKGKKVKTPEWLLAYELVETKGVLAHTVAALATGWIAVAVPHLCKRKLGQPYWSERNGRVQVSEVLSLYGVALKSIKRDAAVVCPEDARRVFIRSYVLVTSDFDFAVSNRQVVQQLEEVRHKTRVYLSEEPTESLLRHYLERLPLITSIAELRAYVESNGSSHLLFTENILRDVDVVQYPDEVNVSGAAYRVVYRYSPGAVEDGVSLRVPLLEVSSFPKDLLPIPALRAQQVKALVRSLPKELRKQLAPVDELLSELAEHLEEYEWSLQGVRSFIETRRSLVIAPELWSMDRLPSHLQVKLTAVDLHGQQWVSPAIDSFDSLDFGLTQLEREFLAQYQRTNLTKFDLAKLKLPAKVLVGQVDERELYRYPALTLVDEESVEVCLYDSHAEALAQNHQVVFRLVKPALHAQFLECSKRLQHKLSTGLLDMQWVMVQSKIVDELLAVPSPYPITQEGLLKYREQLKSKMPQIVTHFGDLFKEILPLRSEVERLLPKGALQQQYQLVFSNQNLSNYSLDQLDRFPVYLKAWRERLVRAQLNPRYELSVQQDLEPFYRQLLQPSVDRVTKLLALEEYKLSLFLPHLRGSVRVGLKRLGQLFACIN